MKILVLNLFLQFFTGSEINAMQLCEGLKSLGFDADIGTLTFGSPMRELVAKKGVEVINLFDETPEILEYDLIWAHHAPVLAYLLFKKQISNTKIIFSSLSPILPLEGPPVFVNDIFYYLSLSPKNSTVMIKSGVPEDRIHYFPNYAPESFFRLTKKQYADSPQRIAVVSNHPPKEVREFAKLALENNTQVDFIGTQDNPIFVDEELLLKYDLVITIGKTVLYCFALQIPIYCYDHFGGFGYINKDNYEHSRTNNFSGRFSEVKRDERELFSDILDNYLNNLNNLGFLYDECQKNFCLETNLKIIENDFQNIPITNIQAFREKYILAERVYDTYIEMLKEIFFLKKIILDKDAELDQKTQAINQLENEVLSYAMSKSWRFTRPLRLLHRFRRGQKNVK